MLLNSCETFIRLLSLILAEIELQHTLSLDGSTVVVPVREGTRLQRKLWLRNSSYTANTNTTSIGLRFERPLLALSNVSSLGHANAIAT